MARRGRFSKGFVPYGAPLSYVHPSDNRLPSHLIPELEDAALGLTLDQQLDLQDRIDDLYQTLRGERDYLI